MGLVAVQTVDARSAVNRGHWCNTLIDCLDQLLLSWSQRGHYPRSVSIPLLHPVSEISSEISFLQALTLLCDSEDRSHIFMHMLCVCVLGAGWSEFGEGGGWRDWVSNAFFLYKPTSLRPFPFSMSALWFHMRSDAHKSSGSSSISSSSSNSRQYNSPDEVKTAHWSTRSRNKTWTR